jgi:uncharacterized protein YjbJ (UPF0337 family)
MMHHRGALLSISGQVKMKTTFQSELSIEGKQNQAEGKVRKRDSKASLKTEDIILGIDNVQVGINLH